MWADGEPNAIAVTSAGEAWTYRALAERVARVMRRVEQSDGIIAFRASNTLGTVVNILAGIDLHRPVAVLPPTATDTELVEIRQMMGRAIEIDGDGTVLWSAAEAPIIHHPDTALIAFTSGSTSRPRAVQLSRTHTEKNTANCIDMVRMHEEREQIVFAPLSHLFALFSHLLPGLRAGLTTHLYSGVAAAAVAINCGAARGTLSGVPSHWEALLRHCSPQPSLYALVSQLVSSGSALGEGLRRRLAERFANAKILNGYGLSESPRILALSSCHPLFFSDATGLPTPGAELTIRQDGELCVRGALLMLGYLGDMAGTNERIRDGWLRTGDVAVVDASGVYTVLGRLDDVRNVGGERISLVEIDHALLRLPDVRDAAAAVESDDVYGERLVAYLVGTPELPSRSRGELRDALAQQIAWHKVPTRFYVAETLPRNRVDKLQRGLLSQLRNRVHELT
jgi:acyl-CoA synthetase (AMP-forming)/AMP-acid ligase II